MSWMWAPLLSFIRNIMPLESKQYKENGSYCRKHSSTLNQVTNLLELCINVYKSVMLCVGVFQESRKHEFELKTVFKLNHVID